MRAQTVATLLALVVMPALALHAQERGRAQQTRTENGKPAVTQQGKVVPERKLSSPRAKTPAKRPRGWDKGRKEGWRGEDRPPGVARRQAGGLPTAKSPKGQPLTANRRDRERPPR